VRNDCYAVQGSVLIQITPDAGRKIVVTETRKRMQDSAGQEPLKIQGFLRRVDR